MSENDSAEQKLIRALGHPTRRSILKAMGGGEEFSPQELSVRLAVPLPNVAYHVRVLAKCEAITLVRTMPVRGSMQHFYRFAIEAEWACRVVGLPSPAGD